MPGVGFYEQPCHSMRFTEIHPVVRIFCGAHHSLSPVTLLSIGADVPFWHFGPSTLRKGS
jgi:hypothetical protein